MKTIQIIGYKNSGKATLSSEIIETFTETGLKVGVLKHHMEMVALPLDVVILTVKNTVRPEQLRY